MKNIPLYLLLCGTLLAGTVSCNSDSPSNPDQTTDETDTAAVVTEQLNAAEALDARESVDDGLTTKDLGGFTLRVFTTDGFGKYIVADETGDTIDDAVYARNRAVEERFNCNIAIADDLSVNDVFDYMTNNVMAGDDVFDLANMHVIMLGQQVLYGYFRNWYDIPNIDFDRPWWSSSVKNDLTLDGKCYIAISDYAISSIGRTYCTLYNQEIGASYDIADPFDTVEAGKWTIDYVEQITKDLYVDLNANNERDADDRFGYVSDKYSNMIAYQWSFDNPIFRHNGNGELEFAYKTEKMPSILVKLNDMFSLYDGIYYGSGFDASQGMFAKGETLLANTYIETAMTHLRDMEATFYILPYPKWDEAQEEYYTMADGNHMALGIPISAAEENIDTIGLLTEALSAESYKKLVPAYYDTALKVKAARDPRSIAMLDRILENRVFDFGFVYGGFDSCAFDLMYLLLDNDTNFESHWASEGSAIVSYYDDVFEALRTGTSIE